jgi:translation initiation factor IF-3
MRRYPTAGPTRTKGPRLLNDRDRGGPLRLIDDEGNQRGVMELLEALELAKERELDLVEVTSTSTPRTCKLMDYGKFRYQQTKKERGQKHTSQRQKEVKLRPKTEEHDFRFKAERARRFLEKGHKVLVTMMFRGREMAHMDLGRDLLVRFAEVLEETAKVEKEPSQQGRNKLYMILVTRGATK